MSFRGHESDDESIYEDSPVDGYFDHRDVPQETYVEEALEGPSHPKARDSRGEAQSSSHGAEPVHDFSSRPSWMDERTPLLDTRPPPPRYADVVRSSPRSSPAIEDSGNTHSDTEQDSLPANYGTSRYAAPVFLAADREPESMGDSANGVRNDGDYEQPTPPSIRKHLRTKCATFIGKPIQVIILIAMIALVVFVIGQASVKSDRSKLPGTGDGVVSPPPSGNNTLPDDSRLPKIPNFPGGGRKSSCPLEHYSEMYYYAFDSINSFSFIEMMDESIHAMGHVSGLVSVLPAEEDLDSDILVAVAFATAPQWLVKDVEVAVQDESLYFKRPILVQQPRHSRDQDSCMHVSITILVNRNVELTSFEVATGNFDLQIGSVMPKPGQDWRRSGLLVTNATELTTVHGSVSVDYWSSRETRIFTATGSVKGRFALRDLLSIQTRTGSITIDVNPEPADKTSPAPADFTALSSTGSISCHFPLDGRIPEREYRTRVESETGSVAGSYILGLLANFRTNSGSITASILPYAADIFASTLRTETRFGRTEVELLPPFNDPGEVIGRLHSLHTSTTGALSLRYPQEWEGLIDGESGTGSVTVKGRDVETLKHRKTSRATNILAKKGKGGSRLDFSTTTGSVNAVIGDA